MRINPFDGLVLREQKRYYRKSQKVIQSRCFLQPKTSEPSGIRDIAMIKLFQTCHLETHQLQSLNVKDIDLETGTITVLNRRGNKGIRFMSDEDIPVIRRWMNVRLLFASNTEAIFVSLHKNSGRKEPGTRLSRRGIRMILGKYISKK
ncbi:MAG: tyrosine-type recombinase/integrase [Anaerolineaceae bacterium]|nr:tyrosine-type recombinase/integrase [Anaerolineaceae bacterium]